MDGEVFIGLSSSILGGTVVAVVSVIANRRRTQAETRKLEAETDKIRAETALLIAREDAPRVDQVPEDDGPIPNGWHEYGEHTGRFELGADPTTRHAGKASGTIRSTTPVVRGFTTMMQSFQAARYCGKRLRMSAYVRTKDVEQRAWLWMRVDGDGPRAVLAFDNMSNRPIEGTSDWQQYQVVLDVAHDARAIVFGFALEGTGQVWASGFRFDEAGPEVANTSEWSPLPDEPVNLSFDLD